MVILWKKVSAFLITLSIIVINILNQQKIHVINVMINMFYLQIKIIVKKLILFLIVKNIYLKFNAKHVKTDIIG